MFDDGFAAFQHVVTAGSFDTVDQVRDFLLRQLSTSDVAMLQRALDCLPSE